MIDWHVESRQPLRFADAVAAIILVDGARYLLQLRDNIPQIFFPGHWGLFGGGIEPGEREEDAQRREVGEELSIEIGEVRPFGRLAFEIDALGRGPITRAFFEVPIGAGLLAQARLREGARMQTFAPREILSLARVKPYDAFALWQHVNRERLS